MKPFKFVLDVKKLHSLNHMYLPKGVKCGKCNKYISKGKYLDPAAEGVKLKIRNDCIKLGLYDYIQTIENPEDYIITFDAVFVFKNRFNLRDISNMVKLVEDALVLVTKIDDVSHYQFSSSKIYYDDMPDHKLERAYISILPKLKNDLLWEHSKWKKVHRDEYKLL